MVRIVVAAPLVFEITVTAAELAALHEIKLPLAVPRVLLLIFTATPAAPDCSMALKVPEETIENPSTELPVILTVVVAVAEVFVIAWIVPVVATENAAAPPVELPTWLLVILTVVTTAPEFVIPTKPAVVANEVVFRIMFELIFNSPTAFEFEIPVKETPVPVTEHPIIVLLLIFRMAELFAVAPAFTERITSTAPVPAPVLVRVRVLFVMLFVIAPVAEALR
jgi:hypothetical protein